MINTIRRPRFLKIVSVLMAILFLNEIIFPTVALALTGGPSQPEVESFAPIQATDMVDLFSGDFKYNIPLMDVDGYPININYNSNITMDQEASWVGLGWNLNPGVINRSMRGLPDEFSGDPVTKEYKLKEDETYGLRIYLRPEFFSKNLSFLSLGYILTYSTKNGFNVETSLGITPSLAKIGAGSLNVGLNFTSSTNGGFNFTPSVSFKYQVGAEEQDNVQSTGNLGLKIGFPMNSVGGLKSMQLGLSATETSKYVKDAQYPDKDGNPVKEEALDGKETSSGMSTSSVISFVPNSYTPQIGMPIESESYDINLNIGCELAITDALGAIGGFYMKQKIKDNMVVKPAFGYVHNSEGINSNNALLDFNREKDVPYHPEIKYLPVTNRTYDIYSVQGQGISGMFRSYCNDNSVVFDDRNENTNASYNAGLELAFTDIVKGGVDLTSNSTITSSNIWSSHNFYLPAYKSKHINNLLYEKSNYKMVGEATIESDPTFLDKTGNKQATRLKLDQFGGIDDVGLSNNYVTKYNDSYPNTTTYPYQNGPASVIREKRQKRNQYIGVLSAGEATLFGLEKIISSHFYNNFTNSEIYKYNIARENVAGFSNIDKIKNHPSEMNIIQTDGSRYVYGIPAYVTKQVEACFSVKEQSTNLNSECIYDPSDPTTGNTKGTDNYLSKTTLPPYAHSYLLTSVLSPDYVDISGDGPTDDDMGNFTKFNYTSMFATTNQYYKWRTPYDYHSATYNEGLKCVSDDEKGSYIYGEKDIWYLHSIETKNYIVEFELGVRADGFGVTDEDGGRNSINLLRKLKTITLYSKKDRLINGTDAIPIKVVHFEYTYDLCKGVLNNYGTDPDSPSNNGGKLTLKKIYFTYGKSYKGRMNPYIFNYDETVTANNPVYKVKGCDRWGFFKPETNDQLVNGVQIPSYIFPYVDQRKSNTDVYVAAWSLREVTTPSGATIKINYESDDYAYVQDKRAMQMMQILGFGGDENSSPGSSFLYASPQITASFNNYIYIKVPEPVSGVSDIKNKYLEGIDQLYFKCLTLIGDGKNEYIAGYARILDYGVTSNQNIIWIKTEDFNRPEENPVSVASWQFCMEHAKHFIDGTVAPGHGVEPLQVLKTIAGIGILSGIIDMVEGPWNKAKQKGIGMLFDNSHSWVRLQNPSGKKLGGGSRVKEIDIVDNWSQPISQTYGQSYDYTITENFAGSAVPVTISSGVASYEPMSGADEIPQRTAVFYMTSGGFLRPDMYGSLEMPLGESFFPAPSVGYRQVTVKSLDEPHGYIKNHATGKVVNEFYTAKDFPVKYNDVTDIEAIPIKTGWFENLFAPDTYNKMFVSQGYLFEINDMHGKQKSQKVYAEGNNSNPISGVEYYYKLTSSKDLDNNVKTINRNGDIEVKEMNIDYDIVNDFRECNTLSTKFGAEINLSFFLAGIFPIFLPPVWFSYSSDNVVFRSSVTTKVINHYGILQDVVKFDQSSRVKTSNELYDAETGEVLLTKTQNAFDDPLYSLKYPAHWAYRGMEPAYKNTAFVLNGPFHITTGTVDITSILSPSNTQVTNTSARELFSSGDELEVVHSTLGIVNAWILDVTDAEISLIDFNGNNLPNGDLLSAKVIHSGRKNQQTLPIGSLVSRISPISPVSSSSTQTYLKSNNLLDAQILESEAVEYDNVRKAYCGLTNWDCIYLPTRELLDLQNLMNYLLTNNKLFNVVNGNVTHIIDLNSPEFANYFPAYLKNEFPSYYFDTGAGFYLFCKHILNSGNNTNGIEFQILPFSTYGSSQNSNSNFTMELNCLSNSYNTGDFSNIKKILSFTDFSPNYSYGSTDPCPYQTRSISNVSYQDSYNIIKSCMLQWSFNFWDFFHPYYKVSIPSYSNCGIGVNQSLNPYTYGILGNWVPRKSYKYLAERKRTINQNAHTSASNTNATTTTYTNIKEDGNFTTFSPFWEVPTQSDKVWTKTTNTNWVWTNEITIKDRNGTEIENKNALGIHSAALFGSSGNLPIAVAANTMHKEILFDGFEEVFNSTNIQVGVNTPECQKHFNYIPALSTEQSSNNSSTFITNTKAHSGKYSMLLEKNRNVSIYTDIEHQSGTTQNYLTFGKIDCESRWSEDVLPINDENIVSNLTMNQQECQVPFSPDLNTPYILSYWVSAADNSIIETANIPQINIVDYANPTTVYSQITANSIKVSKPIEGWQRVEWSFTVPATSCTTTTKLLIKITNPSSTKDYYFDDLRIHPQKSSMKSYVYDEVTKRLMAEMDDNNYASFYEYDEDGALIRIKKETEKGVFTIKEVRKSLKKN